MITTRELLAILFASAVIFGALVLLARFTIEPMMRNYYECGTIFLCGSP